MKIEIHTTNPQALWNKIKKDIADKKIKTWSIVQNNYLTHIPEQWFKKALLEPTTDTYPSRLRLTVAWYDKNEPTEYIKGLYIGRFTEELLEHYNQDFTKIETYA